MTKITIDRAVLAQQDEPVTEDMKSAVRWAPSSAYWSQRLREFFGPDAREGIDALERRLAEAQQAEPMREPDDGVCDGLRGGLCIHQDPNQCDRQRDCPASQRAEPQDAELSAALGWPGGISEPVLDRKTLLQMVAALAQQVKIDAAANAARAAIKTVEETK